MLYTIDPDVFTAAETDNTCQDLLKGLTRELVSLRFAVDKDAISREYLEAYVNKWRTPQAWDRAGGVVKLLQILLDTASSQVEVIPNDRESWLEDVIATLNCTTKVEPEMIGMVQNARGKGLTLLLPGNPGAQVKVRHRGLRDKHVRHELSGHLRGLKVRFAEETVTIPPTRKLPLPAERDRHVETKIGFYLQSEIQELRCVPTPDGLGEEVDIYGRKERKDRLNVYVGENKLRKEGNEARKPLERGEIKQLLRKMRAAIQHEKRGMKDQGDPIPIAMTGMITINTPDFEDTNDDELLRGLERYLAIEWLEDLQEGTISIRLLVVHVLLPRNWSTRADFSVQGHDIIEAWEIFFDGDEWHLAQCQEI